MAEITITLYLLIAITTHDPSTERITSLVNSGFFRFGEAIINNVKESEKQTLYLLNLNFSTTPLFNSQVTPEDPCSSSMKIIRGVSCSGQQVGALGLSGTVGAEATRHTTSGETRHEQSLH